jgi:hypothetical protein
MGMMSGPGGTSVGRFRQSSGGQTDRQQEVEGTLQEPSVHRVFPLETMAIKMLRAPEGFRVLK